jgi:hypothetical protein
MKPKAECFVPRHEFRGINRHRSQRPFDKFYQDINLELSSQDRVGFAAARPTFSGDSDGRQDLNALFIDTLKDI